MVGFVSVLAGILLMMVFRSRAKKVSASAAAYTDVFGGSSEQAEKSETTAEDAQTEAPDADEAEEKAAETENDTKDEK